LTRALLSEGASRVIAIERDERTCPALEAISERYPGRVEFHLADALGVNWPLLVGLGAGRASIVANLPYNIATVLLVGWLETEPWPPWWSRMVLMFQKEVAERIVAAPGTKAYGRLAVLAQWRTRPRVLFSLNPEAFTPPPAVASAVVDFAPIDIPAPPCAVRTLAKVTAAAFGQRRKMLRQSLRTLVENPEPLLSAAGLDPTLRAEMLSVSDFGRLAYVLERWSSR
jgi:16S rRNA (adenine1518-N6/adenine1519-N6)-dimethyltransferase